MKRIFRIFIVWCLVLCSASALAGEDQRLTRTISPIDAAKLAIKLRDYDTAQKILELILKAEPNSTEALFLIAETDSEQGKFADSLSYYRRILVDHPELVRVRLDLARAEFETGADESADYNFRLALAASNLPDTVVDNIGYYLAAIQSRKTFTYNVNMSIAPDSNMNAASASTQVSLFGLPFELSQNAVQKSGIGVVTSLAGERFTPLATDLRLRTGASLYADIFPGHSQFDDIQTRGTVGPQWLFNSGDVSVLGVVGKRWYADAPYSESAGGRVEGEYNLSKHFQLSSYLEGLSDSYHTLKYYNGFNLDQGNFLTYYFNSHMLVRLIGGVGYQSATTDAYEYWYWRLGVGVQFEFPWGITAYSEADVMPSQYSGIDPFFQVRRADRLYSGKISIYKRDWNFWGMSPVLSVIYTDNVSNIPIWQFHRLQGQLGVTKQF